MLELRLPVTKYVALTSVQQMFLELDVEPGGGNRRLWVRTENVVVAIKM